MDFEIIRPGPGRLIRSLIDELQIIETINNRVRWNPKQWKISPGELIAALIITFFCQRHALYKVCDFYKHQDLGLLFGRNDLCAHISHPQWVKTQNNLNIIYRKFDHFDQYRIMKIIGVTRISAVSCRNF